MFAAAAIVTLQMLLEHNRTHISIPNTVIVIQASEQSPMDDHITPIAWVGQEPWGYLISVRRSTLTRSRKHLNETIFHELCHVAYDHDFMGKWGGLSDTENSTREDRAAVCAADLVVRHQKCKKGKR